MAYPPVENIWSEQLRVSGHNTLYTAAYWLSPLLNKNFGKVAPPDKVLKAGFITYADGVNWNPVGAEGWVWYKSDGTWHAL